jgi:hypothetical protein
VLWLKRPPLCTYTRFHFNRDLVDPTMVVDTLTSLNDMSMGQWVPTSAEEDEAQISTPLTANCYVVTALLMMFIQNASSFSSLYNSAGQGQKRYKIDWRKVNGIPAPSSTIQIPLPWRYHLYGGWETPLLSFPMRAVDWQCNLKLRYLCMYSVRRLFSGDRGLNVLLWQWWSA